MHPLVCSVKFSNFRYRIVRFVKSVSKQKTILVCPLDWGLGHATRMVPLIELLLKKNARVIIGADNRPLAFLKKRFAECEFVRMPGYQPTYPARGSMLMKMIRDFPTMLREARRSKILLDELVEEMKIDVVISDNRYELSTTKAYCIFITHQLNIQASGIANLLKPIALFIINQFIKKYDALWIPDLEHGLSLSGKLSHLSRYPLAETHFIGPMSRFGHHGKFALTDHIDLLILLSGPEPQRSILEQLLLQQAAATHLKVVMLQGKPESEKQETINNVTTIAHLEDKALAQMISSAAIIISRPGYSTIMDLIHFNKKAIFIPTPGQTEQQYLADRLMKQGFCIAQKQKDFNLQLALEGVKSTTPLSMTTDGQLLEIQLDRLLKRSS